MIKSLIFLFGLFGLLSNFQAYAQEDVQHIRDVYKQVNKRIKECNELEEEYDYCGFYKSEVVINANNQPWRAVGEYQKREAYWHTDDPGMAESMEVDPATMLSKVVAKTESTYQLYEEYLFEEGQLIFYYYKFEYPDKPVEEIRLYFKDNELVSSIIQSEDQEDDDFLERYTKMVQKNAGKKIQTFINMF